jgi:hypothetical protein
MHLVPLAGSVHSASCNPVCRDPSVYIYPPTAAVAGGMVPCFPTATSRFVGLHVQGQRKNFTRGGAACGQKTSEPRGCRLIAAFDLTISHRSLGLALS